MEIPLLSYSFGSLGFINLKLTQNGENDMMMDADMDVNEAFESLTIGMIGADEPKARNIGLPPFSCGHVLNNWTTIELSVVFKFDNE